MNFFKGIKYAAFYTVLTVMPGFILEGCFQEQAPANRYTFSGQTVADFLEATPEEFSDFITVLKRAETWGEMDTYGEYTCFAPTNSAFQAYLAEKGMKSVDELTKEDCDTITWTHLINNTFFMSDMTEGSLPQVNLNDRFLSLSFDSIQTSDGRYRLRHCINKNVHIIEVDDTVENGVVQVVDSVIKVAGDFIFDVIKNNQKELSIFFAALNLTGLEDSLKIWKDDNYHISSDSVDDGVIGQGGGSDYHVYYWGSRKTNYTILCEPNSVFAKHDIYDIDDLIAYANEVYHESYPNDPESVDEDFHDRRNPLNRFVSYHILPFAVPTSNDFNCREDIIKNRCVLDLIDPEDYFETFMPHSIMRVSTVLDGAQAGVYINRRGVGNGKIEFEGRPNYRGVKIYTASQMQNVDNEGCNGYYHYIDDILVYDATVRNDVLNRRMRIDCCTLSPDFLTSGARQLSTRNTGFKQPKNFHSYTDDYIMWVRQAVTTNWSYQGDGLDLQGNYDLCLKLPPVPFDGTWELRLSYRGYDGCGVVQNYVGDSPENLQPCGIPTDLRLSASDNHNIGWVSDDELGTEEEIRALDKAMHNRGYMKAPDSHSNGSDVFRTLNTMARRIVTTQYFYADKDYYLRMKLVLDNPKAEMNFDYMEWCPKSVYDNNEDKH